ncbi:MAG: tRNA lysidine(34) synthetase TilS [Clostridiales bacterium]|nr:tRNA lysidine(34) synthetase TilS [Clostridiales bacterium]
MLSIEVELLKSFNRLVFAISGGKDSMALLHFAINHLDHDKFYVITVHHNLRGKEGQRDRDFVVDYCKSNGIKCEVYEEQIKEFCEENGYTIEQGARIRRREIFKDIVLSKKADRVVTAHQKDDQIESILMHIFRGSGIKGLVGMEKDDGIIIRPMLNVSTEDIKQYIKENKVPFVQDSTNFELEYSRNKIRNVVLKEIEKVYPNVGENILRLAEISQKTQSYIDEHTPKAHKEEDGVSLYIKDIASKDITASQAIINAVDMVSTRVDLEKGHIESIFDLIDKESGKQVDLPFNTCAVKEGQKIVFFKKDLKGFEPIPFTLGTHIVGEWVIKISKEDNGGLRADLDVIKDTIICTREPGMTFKKYKGGTKSLGDYLTDIKVPKRLRDYLPIIAKNQDVYAVLPYEIADIVAITDKTKEVVYIKAERVK